MADPITVGELTDVPAPESAVNAQFHQEVANRITHRFANTTQMNAWAAGDGSLAYVPTTLYRRVSGAWVAVTDANALAPVSTTATNALNAANAAQTTANAATTSAGIANNKADTLVNNHPSGGFLCGSTNITTDVNGDARINYSRWFTSRAFVVAVPESLFAFNCVVHSTDHTGFTVRIQFGAPLAPWTGSTTVNWMASGANLS